MSESRPGSCRFQPKCRMFPQFLSKAVLGIYKARYCNGRYEQCERFQRASAGEMPPANMLPDGDRLEVFTPGEAPFHLTTLRTQRDP